MIYLFVGLYTRTSLFVVGEVIIRPKKLVSEFQLFSAILIILNYANRTSLTVYEEKRARPYSFGLGKRFDDDVDEKRARMYDFGLGKRLPLYNFGLGKRARSYNFGLGKRLSSKFNFGLGKRQRDMHRFNFGLGKRSAEDPSIDDSDNYYEV